MLIMNVGKKIEYSLTYITHMTPFMLIIMLHDRANTHRKLNTDVNNRTDSDVKDTCAIEFNKSNKELFKCIDRVKYRQPTALKG